MPSSSVRVRKYIPLLSSSFGLTFKSLSRLDFSMAYIFL
nr:MAG TPA: hypothetical protein [Bacteriophage sp.]